MIKIVTDSAANRFSVDGVPFTSVPLKVTGSKEFVDQEGVNIQELVDDFKSFKGKSGTSCPNVQEFLDAFEDADEVICFTISKNLSGSYNAARLAIESCDDTKKVALIDTLSAGPGYGIIIDKTAELIKQGLPFEEVVEKVKEYTEYTRLMIDLSSIDNLAKNGRANPIVAAAVSVLNIHLIGANSNSGTLEVLKKVKGAIKARSAMVEEMVNCGYDGGRVRIDHILNPSGAEALKAKILERFPNAEVTIGECTALCSYYAEDQGLMLGIESTRKLSSF